VELFAEPVPVFVQVVAVKHLVKDVNQDIYSEMENVRHVLRGSVTVPFVLPIILVKPALQDITPMDPYVALVKVLAKHARVQPPVQGSVSLVISTHIGHVKPVVNGYQIVVVVRQPLIVQFVLQVIIKQVQLLV
jgi:hypothetical protein